LLFNPKYVSNPIFGKQGCGFIKIWELKGQILLNLLSTQRVRVEPIIEYVNKKDVFYFFTLDV